MGKNACLGHPNWVQAGILDDLLTFIFAVKPATATRVTIYTVADTHGAEKNGPCAISNPSPALAPASNHGLSLSAALPPSLYPSLPHYLPYHKHTATKVYL